MITIRLTDMSGNLIRKTQQMGQPGFSTQTITDLSSLAPGIYMLDVQKGDQHSKTKLVKP